MSGFQVSSIEQNKSYPLGRFQALNRMEYQFWMEEKVRQSQMLGEVMQNNSGLDLPVKFGKTTATSYHTQDVDLLARYSDDKKEIPNEMGKRIKDLGTLRTQNKFLGMYLDNFEVLSGDMNIEFNNDAHKQQVKQSLQDFYNKREETINLTKAKISSDMDKAGITPFSQNGRNLSVSDTYEPARQNWVRGEFIRQGGAEVNEREAERAAEALSKEIMECVKNIREHQEKYESVMQEMKVKVAERDERMEELRKIQERNKDADEFFDDLKQYDSDREQLEHEEEAMRQEQLKLEEDNRQIAEFKEEMDALLENMNNLQEEANMLANEKSIIETMQMFKNENAESLEISLDELKNGPQNSAVWSFFDSLGKALSAAWTGIANYFSPPAPTNQPEKSTEIALDANMQEKQIEPPKLDGPTKR